MLMSCKEPISHFGDTLLARRTIFPLNERPLKRAAHSFPIVSKEQPGSA